MKAREYVGPSVVVIAVSLWMLGCGETATSPGADFKKGKPPTQAPKVTLSNLNLSSSTFVIEGSVVPYTVDIVNSGKKQDQLMLQAEISQESSIKGAGGFQVDCGEGLGFLPHGTCSMSSESGAYNGAAGSGTLVAGPATLIIRVLASDGSTLALTTAAITLQ